jgi:tRNA (cytidine56-2'-O)-methyltransferase
LTIEVLRLGHRPSRDKRITTHVGLVARAFGADKVIIAEKDKKVENTLNDVTNRFGGPFETVSGVKWRNYMRKCTGTVVHLTMYGEKIDDVIEKIPQNQDLLIVVGAEKVPKEIYELADYNVAVGNQPHSEVAALALFLDRFLNGKELNKTFREGKLRIKPSKSNKIVEEIYK